ncbi:MAG: serine/threonine protein kinase [Cyanobacteria bacterium REEB67]|nr:serine/threonine protein kinase [Cyanobacteria bacterium REEB67]
MNKIAGLAATLNINRSKASAGSVRRVGRARVVELNGPAERIELFLLIFAAPLWGVVFPIMGLSTISTFPGWLMLGASLFCCLHFLHLFNSKFSFEENGLRLPGADHRLHAYSDLKSIYIETARPLMLGVEVWPKGVSRDPAARTKPGTYLVEAQHLTEESARQLWTLFAAHLRDCAISLDVRNRLVNWRTQINAPHTDSRETTPELDPGSAWTAWSKRNEARESQIGRDLSLSVDLKPFNPLKLIGQYMASYSDTFRKTWLTFWCIIAAFAYPFALFGTATRAFQEQHLLSTEIQNALDKNARFGTDFIESFQKGASSLQQTSWNTLGDFFGNNWGAIGLITLVLLGGYKLLRHINDPDAIFIDYLGITTQKRTPTGVMPKEHRSWKMVESMHLLRPGEKSNASRWSIVFACQNGKAPIEVPFKAFASDRVREGLLECIDSWGRNIIVDPKLLEALAPINQTSYTELWMSALAEAPKIDEMTPHSIGLRLEGKNYEILSQLASGGQGIAYLARKTKSSEQSDLSDLSEQSDQSDQSDRSAALSDRVVLKETILPIFVDERARTKAVERFNRDAKLLASLEHPMIVRLDDFFVENNRAYLALEYVPGKTLKETVESNGPLPEAEVRRLAVLMAEILTYLHERTPPVVHRDFTPDNLILSEDGSLKLIDFDVAMEQSNFSQTNATIVGKQAYIPLEQFRGKPCPQSDIYALGATLAFLLTGEEPSAIQASHPRTLNPEISENLDDIIAAATEAELSMRTADARTLAGMLQSDEHGHKQGREQGNEKSNNQAASEES